MIGGMLESRYALTANLHFAWSSTNINYYDLDTCMLGNLMDPVTGGAYYNKYFVDLEDAPGIGADIDSAFLDKCEKWSA